MDSTATVLPARAVLRERGDQGRPSPTPGGPVKPTISAWPVRIHLPDEPQPLRGRCPRRAIARASARRSPESSRCASESFPPSSAGNHRRAIRSADDRAGARREPGAGPGLTRPCSAPELPAAARSQAVRFMRANHMLNPRARLIALPAAEVALCASVRAPTVSGFICPGVKPRSVRTRRPAHGSLVVDRADSKVRARVAK